MHIAYYRLLSSASEEIGSVRGLSNGTIDGRCLKRGRNMFVPRPVSTGSTVGCRALSITKSGR